MRCLSHGKILLSNNWVRASVRRACISANNPKFFSLALCLDVGVCDKLSSWLTHDSLLDSREHANVPMANSVVTCTSKSKRKFFSPRFVFGCRDVRQTFELAQQFTKQIIYF